MARRIRWQIVIATISALLVLGLMSRLALSSTAVPNPLVGGMYVEAVLGTPVGAIPLLNNPLTDPVGHDLGALLFDGLTRIGIDGLPEPALAAAWQASPSGDVYTFNLRRNITWHDGQPFTADDVIFTLRAIQDSRFAGDTVLSNLWRDILVDRIDKYTIRCTLKAPYAPFLNAVRLPIMPAHLLNDIPVDQWSTSLFAQKPIGTGPYRLLDLTPHQARLEVNTNYFGARPFIEAIELRFMATPEAAISALIQGEIHAFGADTSRELAQIALPRTLKRIGLPLDEYTVLTFNLRRELLANQTLRQALARGLDKDRMITQANLTQEVSRLDTPILTGWWAYDPTIQWYPPDLAAATRTLSELGFDVNSAGIRERDGEPLILPIITDGDPRRLAVAEAIALQWRDLNIQVDIEQLDTMTMHQQLRNRTFTIALHGWTQLGADPDVFELWHSIQANAGLNYAGLRDDIIDNALIEARTKTELAVRNDYYRTFQQRWIDLAPSITLYQPHYTFVFDEQLGGLGFDPSEPSIQKLLIGREDRYRNIIRWFLNSSQEIRGHLH